jgi:hypothetical protein
MLAGVADGFDSSLVLGASGTACTTRDKQLLMHQGSKQQLPTLLCLTQLLQQQLPLGDSAT